MNIPPHHTSDSVSVYISNVVPIYIHTLTLQRHFHNILPSNSMQIQTVYISSGCLRLFIYYPLEHFLYNKWYTTILRLPLFHFRTDKWIDIDIQSTM